MRLPIKWEEALALLDLLESQGVQVSLTEDGRLQVRPARVLQPDQWAALGRLRVEVLAVLPRPDPEMGILTRLLAELKVTDWNRSFGCSGQHWDDGGHKVSRTVFIPLRRLP